MSVQPGVTYKRYVANGVATIYSIPFLIVNAADLMITLNGVEVTSGFTLTGVGNPTSTCTFAVAPTGDLLFQLDMIYQRQDDFQENGDFLAATVNREYDRLWLAVKQVSGGISRSLTVSVLEPEGIAPIPLAAERALRVQAYDASGVPVMSNLTLAQLEAQPAGAAASATAAAASASDAASSRAWASLKADQAAASEAAASASANLSQRWANEAEDVVVSGGQYSSYHWSRKSQAALTSLQNRPGGLVKETIYATPGSFTFTKDSTTKSIMVEVWGGGGPGGAGGSNGGTSSFGTISATGGAPGSGGFGGAPGSGSGGDLNITGAPGGGIDASGYGAPGGSAPRGGSGGRGGGTGTSGAQPGGGGGASGTTSQTGGSGGYSYGRIASPTNTYSVVVGAAGSGSSGSAGGAGMVIVREYA